MRNKVILITALIVIATCMEAQQDYLLNVANSKIIVEGTSNLHDWEMEASQMQAKLLVNKNGNSIDKISGVEFEMSPEMLKSNSSIMDKKTLEALKAKKYKNITFELSGETDPRVYGNTFSGSATGYFNIAGITREVSIPYEGVYSGNRITVNGKVSIGLPQFNISPPTALMGTLKTGEKVEVRYQFEFISAETYTQYIK